METNETKTNETKTNELMSKLPENFLTLSDKVKSDKLTVLYAETGISLGYREIKQLYPELKGKEIQKVYQSIYPRESLVSEMSTFQDSPEVYSLEKRIGKTFTSFTFRQKAKNVKVTPLTKKQLADYVASQIKADKTKAIADFKALGIDLKA
jgi:hypothetical protein